MFRHDLNTVRHTPASMSQLRGFSYLLLPACASIPIKLQEMPRLTRRGRCCLITLSLITSPQGFVKGIFQFPSAIENTLKPLKRLISIIFSDLQMSCGHVGESEDQPT
ncbi:hypothetical protein J6590_100680 [Homalodisca vitripennis]|nr:hypothetical protein J6590_100680 [Homalodisca vitripennis]